MAPGRLQTVKTMPGRAEVKYSDVILKVERVKCIEELMSDVILKGHVVYLQYLRIVEPAEPQRL